MRQMDLKIAIIGYAKMIVDFHERNGFGAFDLSFSYHLLPSGDLRKWNRVFLKMRQAMQDRSYKGFCFIRIERIMCFQFQLIYFFILFYFFLTTYRVRKLGR